MRAVLVPVAFEVSCSNNYSLETTPNINIDGNILKTIYQIDALLVKSI
jgi:hypothetical protein